LIDAKKIEKSEEKPAIGGGIKAPSKLVKPTTTPVTAPATGLKATEDRK